MIIKRLTGGSVHSIAMWRWRLILALCILTTTQGKLHGTDLASRFENPPPEARSWVFWYWMKGCVSAEGITADLEAMKEIGIGGAYLMPIKGPTEPALYEPPVVQLSPKWWKMVRHAMQEADRLDLQLAMHACDGFAVAGGPWITPELSMQKVVWSSTRVTGGKDAGIVLPQPETNEGYYRDIAVLAFPSLVGSDSSKAPTEPTVTTSLKNFDGQFLVHGSEEKRIRMAEPGWIQFSYEEPFTCRSLTITPDAGNFQSQRLLLEASEDGATYRTVTRLQPPRHGWQNGSGKVTHAIPPTTAKFFRFVFDKEGTEPGSEDLDSAKWSPVLKLKQIGLCSEPRLHQFRGKNGQVYRVSPRTTRRQIADANCVPLSDVKVLTDLLDERSSLAWNAPPGNWTILRIGHTSTGSRNETGGGGKGLECDKLNAEAVRFQFDQWFGEIIRQVGPELAGRVLKGFHVDSWECGSQNWTSDFAIQFKQRHGYDLLRYLPAIAGIPIESAEVSERFLYDVRQTVSELLQERFFETMSALAAEQGCRFSAECVAPTMLSDGTRHFAAVDIPMGEFWLRSPTHDKPNDIRDAISAAHVYGKRIVQAEAYTQIRMNWTEHPGMMKALGDRHFCLGVNRLVMHVFTHNPWMDRQPGMTLDNIGLYFQRDQTWWKPGKAWLDYLHRCQALLQVGTPIVDIAVLTGQELPRRAILPERLIETLPELVGRVAREREAMRLENRDVLTRELPKGVKHSANMIDPHDWLDPLRGYAYDSVNVDAILRLAKVEKGRITFPGGASYGVLVVPGSRPMSPHANLMTPELVARLQRIVEAGAKVVICDAPTKSPSLSQSAAADETVQSLASKLILERGQNKRTIGLGEVVRGPLQDESLADFGIRPDFVATKTTGERLHTIAWTHRRDDPEDTDLYFLSNQSNAEVTFKASFRIVNRHPEIWNPLTTERHQAQTWKSAEDRTEVPLRLPAQGSVFIVFRSSPDRAEEAIRANWLEPKQRLAIDGPWQVQFDPARGGNPEPVQYTELVNWSKRTDDRERYYSGTAMYHTEFEYNATDSDDKRFWLSLGDVHNLAAVKLNGHDCGVVWTKPYRVEVTSAVQPGKNDLEIAVTNTWANGLIGDQRQPQQGRRSWTTASPSLLKDSLQPAGLLGPVTLLTQ